MVAVAVLNRLPRYPVLSLGLLPFFGDPAPGVFRSREASRNLQCERLTEAQALAEYPGTYKAERPRGNYSDRQFVRCRQRWMALGARDDRDDLVLSGLTDMSAELASLVSSVRPDLVDATWLVQAYYPNAGVEHKVRFAMKNGLMNQGLSVSDRAPALASGDIDVLTRLAPSDAYPMACERYAATGSLHSDDVLLAVMSLDRRDTALHAGLCIDGRWTWLR